MRNKLFKASVLLASVLALIWFLIRVIPKPSRAFYPCQRAAFPIATSLIIWLCGIITSMTFYRRAKFHLQQNKYSLSFFLIISSLVLFIGVTTTFQPVITKAEKSEITELFIPGDLPNTPMGEAKGVFPGRVVWNYNPEATSWDGKTGYWWEDKNTSLVETRKMLSETIQQLTGTTDDANAWDKLFKYFNSNHNKGEVGYKLGEKIAIKVNMNNQKDHLAYKTNQQNGTPQLIFSLLRQLVNNAGVKASDITFYDVSRYVSSTLYTLCKAEFPEVNFVDIIGGNGRIKYVKDENAQIKWSQTLALEPGGGNPTYIPTCVSQAEYLINLPNLKGHDMAGISLCAKNHFGSFISVNTSDPTKSFQQSAGVHPYVTVHDFAYWNFPARGMGTYNSLVDIMGYKHLGQKTLLFLVDGLYAAPTQSGTMTENSKWLSPPFNNDWPSSLFASVDQVALESVCLDFLRTEQKYSENMTNVYGNVDNYLHEAALAGNPTSKTVYDPEHDGAPLNSLGVHEHWNNETDKQYSRNLKTGTGIELVKSGIYTGYNDLIGKNEAITIFPNPIKPGGQLFILNAPKENFDLELINIKGQTVFKTRGLQQTVFIPESTPKGLYISVIEIDKSIVGIKIVVE